MHLGNVFRLKHLKYYNNMTYHIIENNESIKMSTTDLPNFIVEIQCGEKLADTVCLHMM